MLRAGGGQSGHAAKPGRSLADKNGLRPRLFTCAAIWRGSRSGCVVCRAGDRPRTAMARRACEDFRVSGGYGHRTTRFVRGPVLSCRPVIFSTGVGDRFAGHREIGAGGERTTGDRESACALSGQHYPGSIIRATGKRALQHAPHTSLMFRAPQFSGRPRQQASVSGPQR
jgi:hypothetical protein